MIRKTFSMYNLCSRRFLSLKQSTGIDWAKQEKIIMEPFEYIKKVPSKHPNLLVSAFNHWLQLPEDKIKIIQDSVETMVAWVILLDDIVDDSAMRYGVPSTHRVFGVGFTINAAHKVLLLGEKQVSELGHPSATKIFLKQIDEYVLTLGTEMYWRDNHKCPTEEAFMDLMRKRSTTFAFPVELMQLFSSDEKDYRELAMKIGSFYCMLDDYYNLFQPKGLEKLATVKQENHSSCSDITECKMTLAIVHASQFPDVATELADILKQRTSDPKLQSRAISLLKKHGSDEYVRDKLGKLEEDIRTEIVRLGRNPYLTKLMDDLSFQ